MATKDNFQTMLTAMETSMLANIPDIKGVVYGRPNEKISTDNHYVGYIHFLGDENNEYTVNNLGDNLGYQFQLELGIMIANTALNSNEQSRWTASCDLHDWINTVLFTTNDNWNNSVQWWKIVRKPLADNPKLILQIRI